jgi:hypothetical protein
MWEGPGWKAFSGIQVIPIKNVVGGQRLELFEILRLTGRQKNPELIRGLSKKKPNLLNGAPTSQHR